MKSIYGKSRRDGRPRPAYEYKKAMQRLAEKTTEAPTEESQILSYFKQLIERRAKISDFWPNWRRLKYLGVNHIGPIHTSALLYRTAVAFEYYGYEAFGDPTRERMAARFTMWENMALPHIPAYSSLDIANTYWSLGSLGIIPPRTLDALDHRAVKIVQENCSRHVIQLILRAHAQLGRLPSLSLLDALCAYAPGANTNQDRNQENLVNGLWATAALDAQFPDNPHIRKLSNNYLAHVKDLKLGELSQDAKGQLRDSLLWLKGIKIFSATDSIFENPSRTEKKLAYHFNQAGLKTLMADPFIPDLNRKTDFAFRLGNPETILNVEFDGPYHFNRHTDGNDFFNGSTRFQTALFNLLYPERALLRIPFHWVNLADITGIDMNSTLPRMLIDAVDHVNKTGQTSLTLHQTAQTYRLLSL